MRHIARTKQLTTFAGEEGTHRGWPWVLRCLVHRRSSRGLGCPIQILDTVIYGADGAPEALFYSTGGGTTTVVSRAIGEDEGCIAFAKAVAHLKCPKRYIGALTAAGEVNGAVAFTSGGEAIAIKTTDVAKIGKGQGTPPAGTEALVLLVPTRAPCAELLLSIQHTFSLEPSTAKAVNQSYRLVMLLGSSKRVPCKSSTINRKLERACKKMVLWIEAYSGLRVLRLVLEFVEDALGELCLVRTSECSTSNAAPPYSKQHRSPSPSQSKALRLQIAKGISDELSTLRYGYGIGESAPSLHVQTRSITEGSSLSPLVGGVAPISPGHVHARPHTAISPADVSQGGGSIDAEEWGFGSKSPSRSLDTRRPQTTATSSIAARDGDGGQQKEEEMFRGFAAPGEHDPREIGRTATAGRALGSSQLGGMCHGDFCNLELLDKVTMCLVL